MSMLPAGPDGTRSIAEQIAINLADLRKVRQLSLRELSSVLDQLGCPINPDGLNRIEHRRRKVTVEELLALAIALEVTPARLLREDHTAMRTAGRIHCGEFEGRGWEGSVTDRYAGFVVFLQEDVRSDDAEATIAAIGQIRGVVGVEPVRGSIEIQVAQQRARLELEEKLWKTLRQ